MKSVLLAPVLAAVLAPAALLAAAPALAQGASYYVATPVTPPVRASVVTRSTLWRAQGPVLFAARAPERPVVLCRLLADRAGPIAGFAAGGKPLDADALAECNAKAGAKAAVEVAKAK